MLSKSNRGWAISCFLGALCASKVGLGQDPAAAPAPVVFSKEIAPLLLKSCQGCHGPAEPKGGFQLHTFAALTKAGESGSASVTASDLAKSELYRLVSSTEASERMPKDADPLPAEQIALIKRWIEEGAKFDGPDPQATLASIAPKGPHPAAPAAYSRAIPITSLAFRPDGQELAIGGYHEITIWNPADGALLRRIGDVEERVYGLAYSPDGALLAAAGGTPGVSGEVRLYDPNSGSLLKDLGTMSDVAFDVAFHPAGTRLAACSADRSIRVYDVATGKQEVLIEDHADWVMGIAWNHDGTRLASASRDKTSKLFDAATGESLATYPGHGEPVFGVAFNADGTQIFTSGASKTIQIWKPDDGAKIADIGGFGGEVDKVLVKQNVVLSVCADKTVRQFNAPDRAAVRTLAGHNEWIYSLAFHEGTGRVASGSYDGEVRVWNIADGASISTFKAAPGLPPAAPPAATAAAGQ